MDVEKTIEFILAQQAQAEGRMEGLDRAIERLERAISQTNGTRINWCDTGFRFAARCDATTKLSSDWTKLWPTWPQFTPRPTGS